MPHFVLEYSNNLEVKKSFESLFSELHSLAEKKLGIDPLNCKSRSLRRKVFFVGDGDPANAFAHLTIRLFEGHNPEAKQEVGATALSLLQDFYKKGTKKLIFQPTVEIVEIKKEHYFKLSADEILLNKKQKKGHKESKVAE
jgi:5-carboxymethyl-2-hydroxymuconate isomerase